MNKGLLFALVLVSFVMTATAAMAAPINIKVSIVMAEGDPTADAARQVFKPFIESKTQGRYKVDVYTGGTVGNTDTVFQGIQFGTLHFATESTSNLSTFTPELAVFDLPYLFPTIDSIKYYFTTKASEEFLGYFKKRGVLPVKVLPSTFRVLTTNREVKTLEDIKGLKLRSTASKWHIETIKSLGMNPTPLPSTEMITGIQQNVVSGADPNITALLSFRFCDVAKFVLLSEHAPMVHLMYTNPTWFNGLNKEDKAIFDEALTLYYDTVQKMYAERSVKDLETCTNQYGVKVSRLDAEEKKRWIARSLPMYDTLPENLKTIAAQIRANLGPAK